MSLQVNTDGLADADLFGKSVSDLQTNVAINAGKLTGSLKYLASYDGGGFDTSKGHHFIALHAEATGADSITAVVVPTQGGGAVTLDSDGIAVLQLKDDKSQTIVFTGIVGDKEQTIELDISGLTFETN